MKRRVQFIATGLFALVLLSAAYAAEPPEQLEIGKPAPSFNLPNVDGKMVDSAELLKNNKALVVVFMANHCPVAVAYQDRLIEIQKDYKERGVAIVAISSNDAAAYPTDSFENMKKRAEEKKYNFPYLYDESQEVARSFRATCTPHVFVIDAKGNLAYRGAVDDNRDPKKVTNAYLRDALDAVLAGKPASPATTKQVGCSIKWKKEK